MAKARYVFTYEGELDSGDLLPDVFVEYLKETISAENSSGVGNISLWEVFSDSIKLVNVELEKVE